MPAFPGFPSPPQFPHAASGRPHNHTRPPHLLSVKAVPFPGVSSKAVFYDKPDAQSKPAAEVKEAVKEKVAEVKETTKAAKAAKAETAEKAEPKKTPGRKAAVKEEFVLEFAGKQITQEEIKKKVKENWTKVQKNKIKDIKTIKVFLQPENSCAYYTINDEGNDSYKIEL